MKLLLRYGTRALWSLPPSMQLDLKRRSAQLEEIYGAPQSDEQEHACLDNASTTPRPYLPLIASIENPERICIILQKRIAEYAREVSNFPGLAYDKRELDAATADVIGTPTSFRAVSTTDLLQAYIGVYIYDKILLCKESLDRLKKQPWEGNLHVWLQNNFHTDLPADYGILTLVIDTALSFKALVDDRQLKLSWPRSGVDFDEESMVSWSRDGTRGSTILLALTFTVSRRQIDQRTDDEETDDEETDDEETDDEETDDEETDDEETDDEEADNEETENEKADDEETDDKETDDEETDDEESDDEEAEYQVLYPSTVVLQKQQQLAETDQFDEIERLRHMLVSDRRVWSPIQSSALQVDRDWCGSLVKEIPAREKDTFERPTKRRRL